MPFQAIGYVDHLSVSEPWFEDPANASMVDELVQVVVSTETEHNIINGYRIAAVEDSLVQSELQKWKIGQGIDTADFATEVEVILPKTDGYRAPVDEVAMSVNWQSRFKRFAKKMPRKLSQCRAQVAIGLARFFSNAGFATKTFTGAALDQRTAGQLPDVELRAHINSLFLYELQLISGLDLVLFTSDNVLWAMAGHPAWAGRGEGSDKTASLTIPEIKQRLMGQFGFKDILTIPAIASNTRAGQTPVLENVFNDLFVVALVELGGQYDLRPDGDGTGDGPDGAVAMMTVQGPDAGAPGPWTKAWTKDDAQTEYTTAAVEYGFYQPRAGLAFEVPVSEFIT